MQVRQLLTAGLDVLLPPCCCVCRARLATPGLCGPCWAGLQPVSPPLCGRCGRPLPHALHTDLCGACHASPSVLNPLRCVYRYNDMARHMVVPFKHSDRLDMLPVLQQMMTPLFSTLTDHNPLVIPVPLHRWRFFSRRYNQSAELARTLCQAEGKIHLYQPDLLIRRKNTASMGHLSRTDRRENVRQAFTVSDKRRALAADRDILLIDDVMTTGATLESCAQSLLRQTGCRSVGALVFARVL